MKEKRMTQKQQVLNYLMEHDGITPEVAYKRFGIMRLSAIIFRLREEGNIIKTTTIAAKNRYGAPVRFALYTLEEEL